MAKKLRIHQIVYKQLDEVYEFYLNLSNDREVAQKVEDKFLEVIVGLKSNYKNGLKLSNKVKFDTNAKFVMLYKRAIIYDVYEDEIHVTSIFPMLRDFGRLQQNEDGYYI